MSLNFTKLPYVDGETVIPARNLNEIQDAILDLDDNKVEKEPGKGLSTNDYSDADKSKVDTALQSVPDTYRTAAAQDKIDAAQNTEIRDLKSTVNQKAPVIYDTASGAISSFDDGADGMPLKSLTVNIEPVQSGSGDPSPTNVRPISGWTGCNIYRSGADMNDPTTYPITFPASASTVYGGTLDVVNKRLTVNRAMVDLGTLIWNYNTSLISGTPIFVSGDIPDRKLGSKNLVCENYATYDGGRVNIPNAAVRTYNESNTTTIIIRDDAYSDAVTFKSAMSGVQLIYELATPIVYDLADIPEILTLYGTNNILADCGPVSVNYPTDTKLFIQKVNKLTDDALYAAILSGGGDYKATMRSFFLANGALLLTDLTELCDRWYSLSRTGWTGGVRFSQPQEGVTMSSDGTKTGDNAGLSCTPSTTTEANRDDYAALPLFAVVDCNVTLDDDGKPHVTAIDGIAGGFQRYDPAKIVCCMQMTGWMRAVEDADVFGFDYTDQPGLEGFVPLPEAVELKDNAVRSWVVHCKYGAGDTWGSCSGVPLRVWDVSHNNARTQVRAVWGSRYCAATSADDAFLKIMLYLKYAQLDSDRILSGCVDYNYTYKLALGEAGVERVLLTPAQAANLIVGSCVCVGTASSRNANKGQQTALLDRVRIMRIETVEIDGTSYGAVYVDNGGNTFDSAATYYLYTYQWHTGSTDGVLGNDGGINPTSTRYPVKLQGIEILSGCYEVMGDTILRYEVSGGVNCEVAHVCRDASKIATSVTADYKTCAYGTPCPASNSWQYPKRLGHDAALPEVMLGSVLGGSTSSGTRDGQYIEKYSANAVREWRRWGFLNGGLGSAGLSCGNGGNALSDASWAVGGRLSVTGNRGEYQAAA